MIITISEDTIKSCDLYVLMRESKPGVDSTIYTLLKNHPKINKLHTSIVFDDYETIEKLSRSNDLRANNYRCYTLAKNRGDEHIITLVKDNILLRLLLHKEILSKYSIVDVYSLMCKMF